MDSERASIVSGMKGAARMAGFTLLEFLMVGVILTILLFSFGSRMDFTSLKLSAAARKVGGDIRYAQQLAISTQTRCGLFFLSNVSYRVFTDNDTSSGARALNDGCSDDGAGNFVVDFGASRCGAYSGVMFSSMPTIYFDSAGTPIDSAGVPVAGDQSITLTLNGDKTVIITAETGNVSY